MSHSSVLNNNLNIGDSALERKSKAVALAAQKLGGRALLVGGYVRDALLGMKPKDADIEVYGIEATELRRMLNKLGRVNCVGESFRVYKLVWHENDERFELDVSLPRRDKKVGEGHRGFEVEGDPNASFEDAARRRDFTVNAILCDPLSGEIIDPFGGRADLENRVLKAVDAAHFAEDSLRVLRAMQFAARFEMTIDPQTVELCRSIDLSDLPRERIWGEWEKMLLKSQKPSIGLRTAHDLLVLNKLFPAFEWKDENVCKSLDNAAVEKEGFPAEKQLALMLAALGSRIQDCIDYWQGENLNVIKEIDRPFIDETLLDPLGVFTVNSYDVRKQVIALVENRDVISRYRKPSMAMKIAAAVLAQPDSSDSVPHLTDGLARRLSVQCELPLLASLIRSRGDVESADWLASKMRELGVENGPPSPLLMGRHLLEMGLKPGPRIGEITRAVYEMQLDGDVTTEEEALAAARRLVDEER